jgi:acetyl-CoA acetyltransferase
VDLFEVNEAFACVAMAPMRELGHPARKAQRQRRRVALGHPIGASGAPLIVTCCTALKGASVASVACRPVLSAVAKRRPSPSSLREERNVEAN